MGDGEIFIVKYIGTSMLDKRCLYSKEMIPWIIEEILMFAENQEVFLSIRGGRMMVTSLKSAQVIFDSDLLHCIHSFQVEFTDDKMKTGFALVIRGTKKEEAYLYCRLFLPLTNAQVSEVFSAMKQTSVPPSYTQGLLAPTTIPSSDKGSNNTSVPIPVSQIPEVARDSPSVEVFYVGKVKTTNRKAPPSFIDEALEKFRNTNTPTTTEEASKEEEEGEESGSTDSSSQPQKEHNNNNNNPKLIPTLSVEESSESLNNQDLKDGGEGLKEIVKATIPHPLEGIMMTTNDDDDDDKGRRIRHKSGDAVLLSKSVSLPLPLLGISRRRALSSGNSPRRDLTLGSTHHTLDNRVTDSYNRTMLLIVERYTLKIISPDRKSTLFSKQFTDIYQFSQGIQNTDHFGFICKETQFQDPPDHGSIKLMPMRYVAYIFRSTSRSVTTDILNMLNQASRAAHKDRETGKQSCDHCPMVWYQKLCADIDKGFPNEQRVQFLILKHIHTSPFISEDEVSSLLLKLHGIEEDASIHDQNRFLMLLLRMHCETKQVNHIHDTTQNRHEFLNHFLGGGGSGSGGGGGSEIFSRAKRSLDKFIMRRTSLGPLVSLTDVEEPKEDSPVSSSSYPSPSTSGAVIVSESPLENGNTRRNRPTRSSLGTLLTGDRVKCKFQETNNDSTDGFPPAPENIQIPSSSLSITYNVHNKSPVVELFQKMGSTHQYSTATTPGSSTGIGDSNKSNNNNLSWRQEIFKKVVTPHRKTAPLTPRSNVEERNGNGSRLILPSSPSSSGSNDPSCSSKLHPPPRSRSPEEIRDLWRTAINQQLILIRMEKQNLRLKAIQDKADAKRIKLCYKELGTCDDEATETWDIIMGGEVDEGEAEVDVQLLDSAILRGIPKAKRGQIWQFFITQRRRKRAERGRRGSTTATTTTAPNKCHCSFGIPQSDEGSSYAHLKFWDSSYDLLLHQLTTHQHAILVDIGRTFPMHPYFSGALGSGQLALFNMLKAYSLLDTDVGYCQGLSFVAGLLLMHLEEEEAFQVLRYIMFDLGAREHYKPDMNALQVKLFQLIRLIHDQDPELLAFLNQYDVLPSLYAAPWFLTFFASQFPIGFSVRVLDTLLLHGVDTLAKFAAHLILDNKGEIMKCEGLEQIMGCFKTVVTNITTDKMDKYLRKVLESDWEKQLFTYTVEYNVMNDEAFFTFVSGSKHSSAPLKALKSISMKNRGVQTDVSGSSGGSGGGDNTDNSSKDGGSSSSGKHPILGDLINRQNSEIAKLQMEKIDLRRDNATLLNCIITLQKLAQISTGGQLSLPVPPEITEISAKYFTKTGTSFSSLLESPSVSNTAKPPPSSSRKDNNRNIAGED